MSVEPTFCDLKTQPVVRIDWADIISHGGWVEEETVAEAVPQVMVTYGKIVVESPEFITVCGTWSEECEETFGDINTIPRGCVKSISILSGS